MSEQFSRNILGMEDLKQVSVPDFILSIHHNHAMIDLFTAPYLNPGFQRVF